MEQPGWYSLNSGDRELNIVKEDIRLPIGDLLDFHQYVKNNINNFDTCVFDVVHEFSVFVIHMIIFEFENKTREKTYPPIVYTSVRNGFLYSCVTDDNRIKKTYTRTVYEDAAAASGKGFPLEMTWTKHQQKRHGIQEKLNFTDHWMGDIKKKQSYSFALFTIKFGIKPGSYWAGRYIFFSDMIKLANELTKLLAKSPKELEININADVFPGDHHMFCLNTLFLAIIILKNPKHRFNYHLINSIDNVSRELYNAFNHPICGASLQWLFHQGLIKTLTISNCGPFRYKVYQHMYTIFQNISEAKIQNILLDAVKTFFNDGDKVNDYHDFIYELSKQRPVKVRFPDFLDFFDDFIDLITSNEPNVLLEIICSKPLNEPVDVMIPFLEKIYNSMLELSKEKEVSLRVNGGPFLDYKDYIRLKTFRNNECQTIAELRSLIDMTFFPDERHPAVNLRDRDGPISVKQLTEYVLWHVLSSRYSVIGNLRFDPSYDSPVHMSVEIGNHRYHPDDNKMRNMEKFNDLVIGICELYYDYARRIDERYETRFLTNRRLSLPEDLARDYHKKHVAWKPEELRFHTPAMITKVTHRHFMDTMGISFDV